MEIRVVLITAKKLIWWVILKCQAFSSNVDTSWKFDLLRCFIAYIARTINFRESDLYESYRAATEPYNGI